MAKAVKISKEQIIEDKKQAFLNAIKALDKAHDALSMLYILPCYRETLTVEQMAAFNALCEAKRLVGGEHCDLQSGRSE